MGSLLTGIVGNLSKSNKSRRPKDVTRFTDDVFSVMDGLVTKIKESTELQHSTSTASLGDVKQKIPVVVEEINVIVQNPTTLPEYMSELNQLHKEYVVSQIAHNKQLAVQNELIAELVAVQIATSTSNKALSDTVSEFFPSVVGQLQEISKIPSILSLSREINTAYDDLQQEHYMNLEIAIENTRVTLSNVISSVSLGVSSIASYTYQSLVSFVGINTKMTDVSDNAKSQKVLSDYMQTETDIKNLDGNTVTTAKPMEITSVKNAVNAKNETDEMEFELDDEILDSVFEGIVIPTYTSVDWEEQARSAREASGIGEYNNGG